MASTPEPPRPESSTTPSPPTTKPFRFKRKRSPSTTASTSAPSNPRTTSPPPPQKTSHRRHHHRHHHQRSSRRRPSTRPPPNPDPFTKSPDTAFRESLFDALADDEGAAYWEGVYGQPIHTYSPFYSGKSDPSNPEEENIHRMTEDEYVAYVRGKMWEKSHGYVFEERARREEERKKKGRRREEEEEEEEEGKGREWARGVEEALRRGEERRRVGRWRGLWGRYVEGWEGGRWSGEQGVGLRERICWPVESGRSEDVGREDVERFFRKAPLAADEGADLVEVLKKERVRWHPDKMQQRAGEGGIDAETLKIVTAVFQVIDTMWGEVQGKG